MRVERADREGAAHDRRQLTSQLLVTFRDLSVPLTGGLIDAVGHAYSSNSAVLLLTHLAEQGADRPAALGRITGLSRGAVSNMLKRFESVGVVERVTGPGDGRSVVVSLTSEGRRTERRLTDAVASALDDLQPLIKQAIDLLVDLGATGPPIEAEQDGVHTDRRVAAALAEAGNAIARAMSPFDSVAEAMALAALDVEGPCRVRRVAQMLGITTSGATRLVVRLEDASTVHRVDEVEGDARAVVVAITDEGTQRLDGLAERLTPHLDGLRRSMAAAVVTPDRGDPVET